MIPFSLFLAGFAVLFIVSYVIAVKCEDEIDHTDRALWFFFTGDFIEKRKIK